MTLVQKRLLSLGLLSAAAVAALYLGQLQDEKSEAEQKNKVAAEKILELASSDDARELNLKNGKGEFKLLREGTADGGNQWRLTAPRSLAADATTIEGMLARLSALQRKSVVPGLVDEAALTRFGLAPAAYRVQIKDKNGVTETLLVGGKNSFDGSIYVKVEGNEQVLLVAGDLVYQLDKDEYALREKRLLVFNRDDVQNVAVSLKDRRYSFARSESGFELQEPLKAHADEAQANGIVAMLADLRAKVFVQENPDKAELKKYGIDKDAAQARLQFKNGGTAVVYWGELKKEGNTIYYVTAERPGEKTPLIELQDQAAFRKLDISAEDLRDKHVFNFDRLAIGGLKIKKGGDPALEFSRQGFPGEGDTWTMTAPMPQAVQNDKMAGLLYKLWNLKATRVIQESAQDLQKYGLDKPLLTVQLYKRDKSFLGEFYFGKIEGREQFATSGEKRRIDAVEKTLVDEISTTPADYEEAATAKK